MNDMKRGCGGMLLSPKQAAMELAISERHLWNLKIPKVRLGRSVRYARVDVEAYIESRKAVIQ